jgi:hypothetical protein
MIFLKNIKLTKKKDIHHLKRPLRGKKQLQGPTFLKKFNWGDDSPIFCQKQLQSTRCLLFPRF